MLGWQIDKRVGCVLSLLSRARDVTNGQQLSSPALSREGVWNCVSDAITSLSVSQSNVIQQHSALYQHWAVGLVLPLTALLLLARWINSIVAEFTRIKVQPETDYKAPISP